MSFDVDQAMPFASNTLYGNLRRDCETDWQAYVGHRFVRELASGVLDREEFLAWMVQDYLYLIHYTRAYALLVYKSGTVAQMRAAAEIVHALLNTEMSLHRQQLSRAGITEADLERAPESIQTLAYSRYILDRAQTGDVLDLMVTLSACLVGYGEIGLRLLADPATKIEGNPLSRLDLRPMAGLTTSPWPARGSDSWKRCRGCMAARLATPCCWNNFVRRCAWEAAFWDAGLSPSRAEGAV